jgi:hypothetical protein
MSSNSLQVFEEKLTTDVVAAVNAIKPRIMELSEREREKKVSECERVAED